MAVFSVLSPTEKVKGQSRSLTTTLGLAILAAMMLLGNLCRPLFLLSTLNFQLSTPVTEPTTIPLTFPNGVVIQVKLARTPQERNTGLMGRSSLPSDHGMLFVFEQPDSHFFWMKNTLLPLDIVWLSHDKRVLYIEENVPPCKKDPCPAYGPPMKSLYVLEVNAGVAQRQGLSVGMTLKF